MSATDALSRFGDSDPLDAPIERRRMLLIVNPHATTVSDRLRKLVVHVLQARYDVTAVDTRRRGHATELAREAIGEGFDVVVAFGGDGTLNEVVNGLHGSDTPLTMLPGGATSVFAKLLGIPGDIVDATEHLFRLAGRWEPRKIDVAQVNDRLFTFTAGIGLDADVVARIDSHPNFKARLGTTYYAYAAITTYLSRYVINPPKLDIELPDGTKLTGATTIVQNAERFTFLNDTPLNLAQGAKLDSGDLAGIVLNRTTPTIAPSIIARLLIERLDVTKHGAIDAFSGVDGLVVRSRDDRPVALQLDGEHADDVTEAHFRALPQALTIVA